MAPMKDANGMLRPDLDFREVPGHVMATYLGISRTSFWRRWTGGIYPRQGGRSIGRLTHFRPRVIMGIEQVVAALMAVAVINGSFR